MQICLFAGIFAETFVDESFRALCHVTQDNLDALNDLDDSQRETVAPIAGAVVAVKESIR